MPYPNNFIHIHINLFISRSKIIQYDSLAYKLSYLIYKYSTKLYFGGGDPRSLFGWVDVEAKECSSSKSFDSM